MQSVKKCWVRLTGTILATLIITLIARAQTIPQPIISIAPLGTNGFTVKVTNSVSAATYDLQWTPVLGDAAYPWTWAEIGSLGQSNFVVNLADYDEAYFRVLVDTNAIPLWEAANPNNPGAGILKITITSPTNGWIMQ